MLQLTGQHISRHAVHEVDCSGYCAVYVTCTALAVVSLQKAGKKVTMAGFRACLLCVVAVQGLMPADQVDRLGIHPLQGTVTRTAL